VKGTITTNYLLGTTTYLEIHLLSAVCSNLCDFFHFATVVMLFCALLHVRLLRAIKDTYIHTSACVCVSVCVSVRTVFVRKISQEWVHGSPPNLAGGSRG